MNFPACGTDVVRAAGIGVLGDPEVDIVKEKPTSDSQPLSYNAIGTILPLKRLRRPVLSCVFHLLANSWGHFNHNALDPRRRTRQGQFDVGILVDRVSCVAVASLLLNLLSRARRFPQWSRLLSRRTGRYLCQAQGVLRASHHGQCPPAPGGFTRFFWRSRATKAGFGSSPCGRHREPSTRMYTLPFSGACPIVSAASTNESPSRQCQSYRLHPLAFCDRRLRNLLCPLCALLGGSTYLANCIHRLSPANLPCITCKY